MKVKELREALNSFPEDMEVFTFDYEYGSPCEINSKDIRIERLKYIRTPTPYGINKEWKYWELNNRNTYEAEIIKIEKGLIIG